jgi:hypothetical protein
LSTEGVMGNCGKWIAAGFGLLALMSWAAVCRASPSYEDPAVILGGVAIMLSPSEAGMTAAWSADSSSNRFVLGWSYQFALDESQPRHRIVPSVDLLLSGREGASWRGRLGYRYGRRNAFGGAGIGRDSVGWSVSPEIGVKFAHLDLGNDASIDPSLHLLARADIAPDTGHLRGGTLLLGWNFY